MSQDIYFRCRYVNNYVVFEICLFVQIIISCSRCKDIIVLHSLFLIYLSLENDRRSHESCDINKIYSYTRNNEE